jgi:hypothetical protein
LAVPSGFDSGTSSHYVSIGASSTQFNLGHCIRHVTSTGWSQVKGSLFLTINILTTIRSSSVISRQNLFPSLRILCSIYDLMLPLLVVCFGYGSGLPCFTMWVVQYTMAQLRVSGRSSLPWLWSTHCEPQCAFLNLYTG